MVTFCVKRHHVFFSSLFSRIFELLLCYNVKINKQRRRERGGRREEGPTFIWNYCKDFLFECL